MDILVFDSKILYTGQGFAGRQVVVKKAQVYLGAYISWVYAPQLPFMIPRTFDKKAKQRESEV